MLESVYKTVLKTVGHLSVWVQVPPDAQGGPFVSLSTLMYVKTNSIDMEVVKGTVDRTSISKVTTYHLTIDHDDVWVGIGSLMEKTTVRGRWFCGFDSRSIPNLFKKLQLC